MSGSRHSTLLIMIAHDIRLQTRNGIYYAYAFVLAFYLIILYFVGTYIPAWALGLIIYSDPSVLGFFFLGALMMLEKSEGARDALAITPITAMAYFWSKTITLTAIALLAAILIALFARARVDWPLYLSSVFLISLAYMGIGMPIALKFKTVTGYLIGAAGILTPLILPMFLALYEPMGLWAMLIPPAAQFRLLLVSLGVYQATTLELMVQLLVTAVSSMALAAWGIAALKRELGK